ncbi:MAG: hypothetical protein GXY52_09065 [Chloroflexi bacterium]|nr:hypothetical protein [Chloroflexota bacterium]
MGVAGKLQTQTLEFWRDEFQVSEGDRDLVTGQILEASRPLSIEALAGAIISHRYQNEREAAATLATSGDIYQPQGTYEVGQRLIFTAFDFARGRVLSLREGRNPKYGPFNVMQVQFEDKRPDAAFVCDFPYEHALNVPLDQLVGKSDDSVSEEDLIADFSPYVADKLKAVLVKNREFVTFEDVWFLRELLPEMGIGVLNLAEAMIDLAQHPLPEEEILQGINLELAASPEAQRFALNLALGKDERFVNVASSERPLWQLRAVMPAAVFERPWILVPAQRTQGSELIGSTMLELVEQIGDELDIVPGATSGSDEVLVELNFPHLYAGTLPVNERLLESVPDRSARYVAIKLIESRSGQTFDAWLCPAEGYIAGLEDWYKRVRMCVGGMITLTSAAEPLSWNIAITPVRGKKSEWICSASVSDGTLTLQNQRVALEIKADRNMVIDVPKWDAVANAMRASEENSTPLSAIVMHVFTELAKLSSNRTVHAKSIYSAANMVRRVSAVAVFAELTRRACYSPLGGGFWALDSAQQKVIYQTPEEMFERPLASRGEAIKDPVIQYAQA